MPRLIKTRCCFCHRQFHKDKRHLKWNEKLGHNSYCSKECESSYRRTGKWLICDNKNCKQKFYRILSGISRFNYCTGSCAAVVNNKKYPKWPVKYCKKCKNPFRREGSPYCSMACGKLGRFKYSKDEIISFIKNYYQSMDRVPPKRDLPEISHKAVHLFGSWNNAIETAGLTPNRSHDNRMYRRINEKAEYGHKCDSASEILIDNWLHENKIEHTRNASYPNTKHLADWAIHNGKIFVEYFGLAKDSPRYDRSIQEKINICHKNNIKLVSIYPENLYPVSSLTKIFSKFL